MRKRTLASLCKEVFNILDIGFNQISVKPNYLILKIILKYTQSLYEIMFAKWFGLIAIPYGNSILINEI